MNLLGRVFVVSLAIMSFVFMGLAMAVYSKSHDWKDRAAKARQQVTEEKARYAKLERESNALESELQAEKDSALQQVRKLESEAVRLAERNAENQRQIDQLSAEQRKSVASVTATVESSNKLTSEIGDLRVALRDSRAKTDQSFNAALQATESLQRLRNDLETATERTRELVADTGRMTQLLEAEGMDPNAPIDGVTPRVDGFVSRTQRRSGVQLVEISIGGDDGLSVGDIVQVFRDTKYKGRLEILKTAPDRSVGRVDTAYQQGPILEGDRVATRLDLGR
ncbi:Chromosome partition protein Smc [Planctomycetes bacterium MalM25]|nr:Chromosome partition protein Smc [Planctomycetes bacterium MalM25]